jgi:hypothetical protein
MVPSGVSTSGVGDGVAQAANQQERSRRLRIGRWVRRGDSDRAAPIAGPRRKGTIASERRVGVGVVGCSAGDVRRAARTGRIPIGVPGVVA